jgi:hypothetical protein
MDVVTLGAAKADTAKRFGGKASPPAALGWPAAFALTSTVKDIVPGSPRSLGTISLDIAALFNGKTTALSAPGATFYVNSSTGLDTNAGTAGAPFKSIWKAVAAANTANVPSKIIVDAGIYFRTNNPWYSGGTGVKPLVDIAYVARGGRVVTGTFDPPGTPAKDATFTNTYSYAVANCNRVSDMRNPNRFGNYTDLMPVPTAEICNVTPDSWALVAGTLYINRRDQQAVTNLNTRVFRGTTSILTVDKPLNIFLGGESGNDGFDFEGGSNVGGIDVYVNPPGVVDHVLWVKNCSFNYSGGAIDTASRGVSVEGFQGLAVFENCRADAAATDGFNFHNVYGATNMNVLTINCSSADTGRPIPGASGSYSNNGHTLHEDVRAIDIAGHFSFTRGGAVRNIGTSKGWYFGTLVENDLGDIIHGGVVSPTAYRADDTAQIWVERTKVLMPPGTYGYASGGGTIRKRNVLPNPQPDHPSTGTITTY